MPKLSQADDALDADGYDPNGAICLWALQEGIPDRGWRTHDGKEKAALSFSQEVIERAFNGQSGSWARLIHDGPLVLSPN